MTWGHPGARSAASAIAEVATSATTDAASVVSTDLHGVDWDHHKYMLEVRPAGRDPFRVETKAKVPILSAPQPGDMVKVTYRLKSNKTEIQIEGDPRYDPKIIRANGKQQRAARADALLTPIAMAEHPTCEYCTQPLPCQPVL